MDICEAENVVKTDEGLEAVIFTAQGDMRQAINNLQATHQVPLSLLFTELLPANTVLLFNTVFKFSNSVHFK